jgi:hypothetical protein
MVVHDPKIDRAKKHNLVDIIMITLCATICGMDGWMDGNKLKYLQKKKRSGLKNSLNFPMEFLLMI